MPYIAMELVPNGSLDKEMTDHPGALDPVYVMRLGQQLAEALACAADQGLVHGDVKPENVLFAEDGSARLVDFGLAAMQGDSDEIWGTPYYISPEKVRRQKIDYRADIYSLGGTLYHALTGQPPFEGEDANAVVRARFDGPPRKPSEIRPDLPPELDDIIMRMLELEASMRYPTYQSLLGDLKRYLAKASATATAKTPSPRVRIKGRKPKMTLPTEDVAPVAEGDVPELTPVEEGAEPQEEKRLNLGVVIGAAVGGIVLLILLVVGGLYWYVHAEEARKVREHHAMIVAKQNQARQAIETTKKSILDFNENFQELVRNADKAMTEAVKSLKPQIPEAWRETVSPMLTPPPTSEIADAIAYTNQLLSAAVPEPAPQAETNAAPASVTNAVNGASNTVAKVEGKKAEDPKADVKKPDDKKSAEKKAEAAPAPAEEPAEEPEEEQKPAFDVPAAIKQFNELWQDVYFCRGAVIRVQGHVVKLIAQADAMAALTAEDEATVMALAKLSQDLVDGFDALRGQKFVEQTQRKASVIRSKSLSLLRTAGAQIKRAEAKAARAAAEAAAKAAKEAAAAKAAEEYKAAVEEETARVKETFEKVFDLRVKNLDWDPAIRELNRVAGELKTREGKEAIRTEIKRVECLKALQQQFISRGKGFRFKSGHVVTAIDKDSITLQRQRQVRGKTVSDRAQKVAWTRFYGKKEFVGFMNQMINRLVVDGRETTRTAPLRWSEQLFGAALTLQLLYTEVEGAAEYAPVLVKKAVEGFPASAKTAKSLFPELGIEATEEE